ncbi:hypothetical protein [Paraliomyxa miuraensis]|uniref:hypothetical protein n=1 Tax=Paraliomyxa miuraensis TaxID=376150 RepID=UPI0022519D2F|nr:hypothetical protein [Paraliomyxa miuraensis]MCX4242003.1 hypothetical protein [Paraliomyxa miuraensis]
MEWQAPEGCPEATAVERRVEDLLGRAPEANELRAVGVVHAGPPWRLELTTSIGGRRQQRTLRGNDCRAVAEAAALILAVSVDPIGVDGSLEAPDVPVLPIPPVSPVSEAPGVDPGLAVTPLDEAALPSPRPPPRARPRVHVRVGGGGELGAIPGGTGGVRGGLAVVGERMLLRLEGSYWIDRLAEVGDGTVRRGAVVGLGTVGLQGGVHLGGRRVRVPLVLGLEAGGLRASGVGLVDARRLTLPWFAAVIGTGVSWSITPRVALWATLEGVVPGARTKVRVGREGGSTIVHEPAVLGGRALVGLSFEIPSPRVTDGGPSGDERSR